MRKEFISRELKTAWLVIELERRSSINFSKFWQKVYKNFSNISHETYQTVILNENFIRYQFFHNITIWHINIVCEKKLILLLLQSDLAFSYSNILFNIHSNIILLDLNQTMSCHGILRNKKITQTRFQGG